MAERITMGRLIVGHGEGRRVVPPGTRFDPASLGISPEELRVLDAIQPSVIRRPREEPMASPIYREPVPGEGVESEAAERESAPARRRATDLDL